MAEEPPVLSPFQIVDALKRLDVELLAVWAVASDEEAREALRQRIRHVQSRASAEALEGFALQQEGTVVAMQGLLDHWAAMLGALRMLELEIQSDDLA
jgi:hypothetical protein